MITSVLRNESLKRGIRMEQSLTIFHSSIRLPPTGNKTYKVVTPNFSLLEKVRIIIPLLDGISLVTKLSRYYRDDPIINSRECQSSCFHRLPKLRYCPPNKILITKPNDRRYLLTHSRPITRTTNLKK